MNSRDAAYDDEILRRVIEESKDEAGQEVAESVRRTKRGRSDSEEYVYHSMGVSSTAQANPSQTFGTYQTTENELSFGIAASRIDRGSKP